MPIKNIVTEQRVTKAKLERAKELRREMTPATPSALAGTSPKYDGNSVVFGGGWVGAE